MNRYRTYSFKPGRVLKTGELRPTTAAAVRPVEAGAWVPREAGGGKAGSTSARGFRTIELGIDQDYG